MSALRCLTLAEAVNLIENASDLEDDGEILILPPNDRLEDSDIEDINENQLDSIDPGQVCGELDVIVKNASSADNISDNSDEEILTRKIPAKRSKKDGPQPKWMKKNNFEKPLPKSKPKSLSQERWSNKSYQQGRQGINCWTLFVINYTRKM
ncbi:hypothetical protein HELRODRAFT_183809 [Helobdella robusta]|uniref:Uncharacterized protein n=1 Tax=Helobdella robusta TaxID=6412 RepID=T1FK82_HELRO|nr:hypothetical protein HELRODRAFT_183809 [Helobdella robusta]ESO10284.1 hypothetical protein HELRODRAFT_183809 [Helobdella robusta]